MCAWSGLQYSCSTQTLWLLLGVFFLPHTSPWIQFCTKERGWACFLSIAADLKCPYLHESYLGSMTLSHSWFGSWGWEYLTPYTSVSSHLSWAHSLSPRLATLLQCLTALWAISPLTLAWVTTWGMGKLGNCTGLLYQMRIILVFNFVVFRLFLCERFGGFCNSKHAKETLNIFRSRFLLLIDTYFYTILPADLVLLKWKAQTLPKKYSWFVYLSLKF